MDPLHSFQIFYPVVILLMMHQIHLMQDVKRLHPPLLVVFLMQPKIKCNFMSIWLFIVYRQFTVRTDYLQKITIELKKPNYK